MSRAKEFPTHLAPFYDIQVSCNKVQTSTILELGTSSIQEDNVFFGFEVLISELLPVLNQTVLHKKDIVRFVITNIEVGLFDHRIFITFPIHLNSVGYRN